MYQNDFFSTFFEFLREYENEPEMLNTLKPFIEYGWGTTSIDGVQSDASERAQTEFIHWMIEEGAGMSEVRAAIKLMTE